MKKTLVFLLSVLLAGLCLTACQSDKKPEEAGPAVSIRVEGISENLAYDPAYPLSAEASVFDLLCGLLDSRDIPYRTDSGYFIAIGNDAAGAFGGWDGFLLYCNGEELDAAPDSVIPKEGDALLLCYADPSGDPATQVTKLETQRGDDGLVTITVLGGTMVYTGEGEGHLEYAPIPDAELTVDEVGYVTDENGQLKLDAALSEKDRLSVQAERYTEDGKPLLIRLAPDAMLVLPD